MSAHSEVIRVQSIVLAECVPGKAEQDWIIEVKDWCSYAAVRLNLRLFH